MAPVNPKDSAMAQSVILKHFSDQGVKLEIFHGLRQGNALLTYTLNRF